MEYKQHILDALRKRRNFDGRFNLDVHCPACKIHALQKGGFSVNEGGGLWAGRAYCSNCGWDGPYLYNKDKKGRRI